MKLGRGEWAAQGGEERNFCQGNSQKVHPPTEKNNCRRQLETIFGCCTILQSNHMTKYVKHSSTKSSMPQTHNTTLGGRPRDVQMWKTYESNKSGYLSFRQPCHRLAKAQNNYDHFRFTGCVCVCGKGSVCTSLLFFVFFFGIQSEGKISCHRFKCHALLLKA